MGVLKDSACEGMAFFVMEVFLAINIAKHDF